MGDVSQRTSSATIFVKAPPHLTYIFINQPDTDFIQYIRFTDPDSPTQGKIEGISCSAGPISAYLYDDNSIRLYYTGRNPPGTKPQFADGTSIQEVKLPNAHQESTDVANGWIGPDTAKELNFVKEVSLGTRSSDPTSFLSLTLNQDKGNFFEAAVWKTAGEDDFFQYGAKKANGKWRTTKFQLGEGN